MKRYLLSLALLCLVATGAHAYWQSRAQVAIVTGGGGYTGPGDINGSTGGYPWYGLRAFSAAYATALGNIADIVDTSTGASSCTIVAKATGDADLTSLSCVGGTLSVTTFCTVTHVGCSITKLYDQSGGTNHQLQATLATMPTLTLSGLGGKPVITGNGSQRMQSTTTFSNATTSTASFVYQTSASPFFGRIAEFNNAQQLQVGSGGTANTLSVAFGTLVVSTGVPDVAPHAVQSLASTTLGVTAYIDGTNNTTASNAGTVSGSLSLFSQVGGGGQLLTGFIAEIGFWASDKTANNSTMNSNQHTYWGF